MVVVVVPAECSPQPAVPAAVCKQMSESVPTPLSPLPTAPRALEKYTTQQPDLSLSLPRDAPLPPSSALHPHPDTVCLLGKILNKGSYDYHLVCDNKTQQQHKKYGQKKSKYATHFKIRLKWGLGKC